MGRKGDYYKHDQYKWVTSPDFRTPKGRFAWLALTKPKTFQSKNEKDAKPSTPRYEASLLVEKEDEETISFLKELTVHAKAMQEFFNEGRDAELVFKNIMQDGDVLYAKDDEKYEFCKGCWIINGRASEDRWSTVDLIDASKNVIDKSTLKSGMIGRMQAQLRLTSSGFAFNMKKIQLIKDDGVRLGGGMPDLLEAEGDLSDSPEEATEETVRPEVAAKAVAPKGGKSKAVDLL